MASTDYVAFLRGVNVGGKNPVSMGELRDRFSEHGYGDVTTYIQSGNVMFSSDATRDRIEADVEELLERWLGVRLVVVVRSRTQLRNVVDRAPDGFGADPDHHHSDVVFLRSPLTPAAAMRVVEVRDGVDRAWPGTGVIYFERVSALRTRSRLNRIMGTPEYARMTIRSWSTVTRVRAMLDDR